MEDLRNLKVLEEEWKTDEMYLQFWSSVRSCCHTEVEDYEGGRGQKDWKQVLIAKAWVGQLLRPVGYLLSSLAVSWCSLKKQMK